MSGGAARAAVFGVSDGLVSNVALILGVAGARSGGSEVLIAGLAGLVAGAVSMASGEFVSVQAQNELVERELAIEARAIRDSPEEERRELAMLYRRRGVDAETANTVARQLMSSPEDALAVHAREELGLDPSSIASPKTAAIASFAAFAIGALTPLLPWFVSSGTAAVVASLVMGISAAAGVGALLARFTERNVWRSAARQVLLIVVSCAATWLIGRWLGGVVG